MMEDIRLSARCKNEGLIDHPCVLGEAAGQSSILTNGERAHGREGHDTQQESC